MAACSASDVDRVKTSSQLKRSQSSAYLRLCNVSWLESVLQSRDETNYETLPHWASPTFNREFRDIAKWYVELLEVCPIVVSVVAHVNACRVMSLMLPFLSIETPNWLIDHAWRSARNQIDLTVISLAKSSQDVRTKRLLKRTDAVVDRLIKAMNVAKSEEWLHPGRAWVLDRNTFLAVIMFPAVELLPVMPMADVGAFDGLLKARLPFSGVDAFAVEHAWADVKRAMWIAGPEANHGLAVEWWPNGGSLIGFMRYGQIHGILSDGKMDVVDRDLDIIIVLPSPAAWFDFSQRMDAQLRRDGWYGCAVAMLHRLNQDTREYVKRGIDARGSANLFCLKKGDKSDVLLHVTWVRPVTLLTAERVRSQTPRGDDVSTELLQLHERGQEQEDTCRAAVRGLSMAPRCGGRVEVLDSVDEPSAISDEIACDAKGACWSVSELFLNWEGSVLQSELRLPLSRCEAYGRGIPCPRHALAISSDWHAGEFFESARETPCLALPDIACPNPVQGEAHWGDRVQTLEHNRRLRSEGLTNVDIRILRRENRRLRRRGFAAHNFSGCIFSWCRKRASRS